MLKKQKINETHYIYIDIEIDHFCVEVFERTISRREMIDHSFERKFYGAWHN